VVVKSALKVVLMAGETVVAESEDPALWQDVMSRLYSREMPPGQEQLSERESNQGAKRIATDALSAMARDLHVTVEQLEGACRPRSQEPYLTIDHHVWEAYKRGTPARGRKAVGAAAALGTLMTLWVKRAELADATFAHVSGILSSLSAKDGMARRTVRNCAWLQVEGDRIRLNPARISMAVRFARSFITEEWSTYMNGAAAD